MITGQSDPLMCFNTFLLLAFDLKSIAKPGGAMLPRIQAGRVSD